jgi:hypothetical protein
VASDKACYLRVSEGRFSERLPKVVASFPREKLALPPTLRPSEIAERPSLAVRPADPNFGCRIHDIEYLGAFYKAKPFVVK